MTPGGRTRAPIALQLVALMVVTLIVAQVVTFAVVVVMPPPSRPIYRMEEVAQALRGGSLTPNYGHELVRSTQASPPVEPQPRAQQPGEPPWPRHEGSRRQLASLVGAPEAEVRLIEKSPFGGMLFRSPFGGRGRFVERVRLADRAGPPGSSPQAGSAELRAQGPVPPPGEAAYGVMGGGPQRDVAFMVGGGPGRPAGPGGPGGAFFSGDRPLFGDFTAALRQKDGRWLVVRPKPEPFPNDWQRRLLLWLGGSVLLTAPLGYLFARRITAPIGAFARAAETLGRDPNGPLMALSGPAEVGMAARAFNDMQARLKRYIEDRTAMVGAISHDLRTPLARIRFKIEAAPEPLRASVVADLEQMEQMIASVLAFIRDASTGRPHERLDLLSLVECLVDDAAEVGQDVSLAEGVAATVEADALGLQRLFGNLLDNAVKYGRSARIVVRIADGDAVVEITDTGPGLASTELERVFQPFYRMEAARTLDGGGVGLGLAVARSVARAHGGDVVLVSSPTGLTARVRLPLSAG